MSEVIQLVAALIYIGFILMITGIKSTGVRLIKQKKIHGILVVVLTKILYWFTIIQILSIWVDDSYMVYILPVILLLFLGFLFSERQLFAKAFPKITHTN